MIIGGRSSDMLPGLDATKLQDFRASVLAILEEQEGRYAGSLEEYLRSLWTTVSRRRENPPSYPLFATLIREAFEIVPEPFDPAWLAYEKALSWDYKDGTYVINAYKDGQWIVVASNVDDFAILTNTLLCQIADLNRMDKQLSEPYRYFGIDSPTGNRWYNFNVFTYWESATRGMQDHLRSVRSLYASRFAKCTWVALAALLGLGSSYE